MTTAAVPFQPSSSMNAWHAEDSKHAAPVATFADNGLSAFLCARPRLFAIAFRMLGRAAEAEDIVQDVWLRWQTTDRSSVRNPLAFLLAATTRLAINVLHSARARREICAGSRLPELVDTTSDPGLEVERGEALSFAVLLLLEKLLPTERAAYVLREAFNYPYREIAEILRVEEANARQLVARAREHVSGGRRASVSPAERRRLLSAFVAAARTGDLARLESVLTSDVVSTPDGGGLMRAARLPVGGPERVAKFTAVVAETSGVACQSRVSKTTGSCARSFCSLPISRTLVALIRHNASPYPVNGSVEAATADWEHLQPREERR